MLASSRSFRKVIGLGVLAVASLGALGPSVARAEAPRTNRAESAGEARALVSETPDADPAYRHQIALAFRYGAIKGDHGALNEELQKNGFSATGSAWSISGLAVDLSLWRMRMSLGVAGAWLAPTTIRNASTGATALVKPSIAHVDWGYDVYVSRDVSIYPVAGISFDGVGVTLDPNAAPLVPEAFSRYRAHSEVTVDATSFAVNLGLGFEHFLPFTERPRAGSLAAPGVPLGVRVGYLWPFAHREWIYQFGTISRKVPGLPVVDLGGPYVQVTIGFAWAKEGRR